MAEICCRVLAEADIADGIPLQELLMMEPRSHDQKHFAVICVFRLDCPEYRDGERYFRQQLIQRLLLPEGIIRQMCQEFLIKPDLIQAALMGHFAGWASSEPRFVIVEMVGPPFLFVLACRLLIIPIDQR